MQVQTILKLLGRCSQIGGIYLPIPPGFRHPCRWEDETKADKSRRNRFVETIIRVEAQNKASDTPSLYAVGLCLWYWYKPKARQQFLLHMRLHFRVKELVQCSLFVNRSWHQELPVGFRSYVWSLSHIRSSKIYSTIQYTCKRQSINT